MAENCGAVKYQTDIAGLCHHSRHGLAGEPSEYVQEMEKRVSRLYGWRCHLSMFKKWRKEYHVYMDGADMYDYPIEDASDYALCDLLSKGEEMTFVYDFGDSWRHTVKVLDCLEYDKDEKQHISLLDGKNACPPNDVGGINGYKEMLRILKEEPDDEEAQEYYTWLGSKWDEKFFPAIDTAIALNELNHM